ncbi:MAG: LLM class flavin-dependent oxidoreductase [Actinomycetota bacterium]
MRFGYGLITCQRYPGETRTDSEIYGEALELCTEAETLGFDSVWTSEHHFNDDSYMPSLLTFSAAVAARTSRIEIGTGLVLAPLYHPLRLAEDAATVDVISGGRLILGLGMGWNEWEFEALGVPIRERVARTVDAIEICRQAWGPGRVESAGVGIYPKPARPGGPPIWLGANADRSIRRAAKIADGWIDAEPTKEDFTVHLEWLRDALGSRDDFEIAGYWPVFVSNDGDAWELVRESDHYIDWKYEDAEGARGRTESLKEPPQLDAKAEEILRRTMVCGTPDEVAARIRSLQEIAGPRFTFIARGYYPGMDRALMRSSTRLFAEEVIPRLA